MAEKQPKELVKRWVGYVCPECHAIFRMETGNGGRRAQCPGCASLVVLGGKAATPAAAGSPKQLPKREIEAPGDPLRRTVDDQGAEAELIPDEAQDAADPPVEEEDNGPEGDRPSGGGRKRVKKRKGVPKEPEWEKSKRKRKMRRVGWLMPVMSVALLVALGAGVAYWARSIAGWGVESEVTRGSGAIGDPDDPGPDSTMIDVSLTVADLEEMVMAFCRAESVDDLLETVRHRERLEPVIRRYYAKGYEPVPVRKIAPRGELQTVGGLVSVVVELEDFSRQSIALEKSGETFLVDWESWVRYSELPWEEFMRQRPTEPKLFRVKTRELPYYNFDFDDDRKWQSFALESPDGEHTLYGYVPRHSSMVQALKPLDPEMPSSTHTVMLCYPTGANRSDQVLVKRVVTSGWVVSDDGAVPE
jgi:DNA-directed RNA polymerase subunit RPC12/RpoP